MGSVPQNQYSLHNENHMLTLHITIKARSMLAKNMAPCGPDTLPDSERRSSSTALDMNSCCVIEHAQGVLPGADTAHIQLIRACAQASKCQTVIPYQLLDAT